MKRPWRTRAVVAVMVVGVGAVGFRAWRRPRPDGDKQKSATVARADLVQRVTVAGSIVPKRRTVISPPYPGFVQKLFVKIGDRVKQGDPILSIVQSLSNREDVYPIRAPFPGVVVQVLVAEGEYVREGDAKKFLVRIDDLSGLFVQADVPELDMVKIRKGQEAVIKVSAILDRSYKGAIQEIALSAKERDEWGWGGRGQVEYAVRISVDDADDRVRPGMSALLDVITQRKPGVLSLRHEFLLKEGAKHTVNVEGKGRREVGVGIHNEEAYEITSGLNEGERVLPTDFGVIPGDRG